MATKTTLGVNRHIIDQENLVQMTGKVVAAPSRSLVSSRPALGEVGNKVHIQNRQNDTSKKAAHVMGPPQALQKIKEGTRTTDSGKENTTVKKKSEKAVPSTNKTASMKRQDSILKPLVSQKTISLDEPTGYSTYGIIDPDTTNKSDPQMVVEYLGDIFSYLRDLEVKFPIRQNFLESHHTTPRMRMILVNWLVEVHMNFKLCQETLHMCISLVDRYLQDNKNVGRETLQLVGTSALFVASKYEEMYVPELSEFVYICDDIFSPREILQMEIDILKKLQFNLGRPLSIHFLRRFNKIAQVKPEQHTLAKYLLELALMDYEVCYIKPSIQAAAACCLSMSILEEVNDPSKVWTPTLVHFTTYKYSDFKAVVNSFANLVKKSELSKYQAVRKKYASAAYGKISLNIKLKCVLVRRLSSMSIAPTK